MHAVHRDLSSVFKAYDIRGVVPGQLDGALAHAAGRAFATVCDAKAVAIGQDMRPSSEPLATAFAEGLTSQGLDVIRVGLCSTDMLYFVAGHLDVAGAMFTASHNPAQYNGIKLCRPGAVPVGQDTGLTAMRRLIESGELPADAAAAGTVSRRDDLLGAYAAHVRSFVDVDQLQPLKVVADAGNGMAGYVLPAIFGGSVPFGDSGDLPPLPFGLVPMYFELDGTFPNHPANPIEPENLVDLRARVAAEGADIGLAFDGDADRVFVVDERGEPVPSSLVGALVSQTMIQREPGATILYNLICSHIVPETVNKAGGHAVRTRVGHSFIKQVMSETGAVFGCEHSGHYYFRDNYRADSGLIAALVVLDVLSRARRPLSEVLEPYRVYEASGEINRRVDDARKAMERVAAAYPPAAIDWTDGLTVDPAGDPGTAAWFNLRPSNTEPLLRLNVEAATTGGMEQVRDAVLDVVGGEPA